MINYREFHEFKRTLLHLRWLQYPEIEDILSPDQFKEYHLRPETFFMGADDETQMRLFEVARAQMDAGDKIKKWSKPMAAE